VLTTHDCQQQQANLPVQQRLLQGATLWQLCSAARLNVALHQTLLQLLHSMNQLGFEHLLWR
jgi:hypothetical protein